MNKIFKFYDLQVRNNYPFVITDREFSGNNFKVKSRVRVNERDQNILVGVCEFGGKIYDLNAMINDYTLVAGGSRFIELTEVENIIKSKMKIIQSFNDYIGSIIKSDKYSWILYKVDSIVPTVYYVNSVGELDSFSLDLSFRAIHINRIEEFCGDFGIRMRGCGFVMTFEDKKALYIEACEAYEIGEQIITDQEFNILESELKELGWTEVGKLYENVNKEDEDQESSSDIGMTGLSIKPLGEWEDIYKFIYDSDGKELIFSLKYDGVKSRVVTGKNFNAKSRTNDNSLDYTEAMRIICPEVDDEMLIEGEAFVHADDLPFFREKYNPDKYKLPRSAALSLLRTPDKHDVDDVMRLNFIAYSTDKYYRTKAEMFIEIEKLGFETPYYVVKSFPSSMTRDEIQIEVRRIMDELDCDFPSDGIVCEFNDQNIIGDVSGKYMSTQVSFKVDKWGLNHIEGKVVRLINNQMKDRFGAVLEIEPIVLGDGRTVKMVNAYNLGIVLREKIVVGSIIKFIIKSNGMFFLKYGGE